MQVVAGFAEFELPYWRGDGTLFYIGLFPPTDVSMINALHRLSFSIPLA
jgi:hypothetical protein